MVDQLRDAGSELQGEEVLQADVGEGYGQVRDAPSARLSGVASGATGWRWSVVPS